MNTTKRIISTLIVIALVTLLYPLTPPEPQVARAATPGKLTNVSVVASSYEYDTEANITFTFTTTNALTEDGDVIRIYLENFKDWADQMTLVSITDDGNPIDYLEYKGWNYIEVYLQGSPVAAGSVIETVITATNRDYVGYERIGAVTFSPNGGGTAYEGCADAGGGGSWDDCTPFYVYIPVGTPSLKARILGPTGTADASNGIYNTYVNLWNDNGYWNWAQSDHLGYFYYYNVPSGTVEMDFSKPSEGNIIYSAPANKTTTVVENITTDLGIIRYQISSATGYVKRQDNNEPVANAYLNFMNYPVAPTSTDENGQFYLPAMDPGTYYVMVEKPWDAEGLVNPDPVTLTVTSGNTTDMGTIYLESANKTVRGYVKYPNGNPVDDAQVGCNTPMGGGWYQSQTDQNGYYELLVGKGHWMCWPEHDYSLYDHEWDWVSFDMPASITFSEANSVIESKSKNFTVTPIDSTIRGKVLKPNGQPLTSEPVNIEIFNQTGGGNWVQADSTDGTFSVGVPAGTYQVMVNMWSEQWGGPSPQKVTVSADSTYSMGTLYLVPKNASIAGSVTDTDGDGLSNQFIDCWDNTNWGRWANGQTDSSGDYSFAAFGQSTYMCSPMTDMNGWSGEGGSETYLYLGAPQTVSLPNTNSEVTDINFELTRADSTVYVKAIDSNGDQLNELWGYAFIDQGMGDMGFMGGGLGGPVDSGSGQFKIPASLCPASSPCNLNISTPPGEGSDWSSAGAKSFSVDANGSTTVNVTMVPNDATLTGYIKDSNGEVITGISAAVFADNFQNMRYFETWVNSDTGQYTLNTAPGTYHLNYFVDPSLGYVAGGLAENKVTTKSGQTVTKDLTLNKIDSYIEVTVLAPNGDPLSGAFVDASSRSGLGGIEEGGPLGPGPGPMMGPMMGGMMGEMSDSNGQVTIGVPGGSTYYVSASLPPEMSYINPTKQTVNIESGETKQLTMQFKESDATISGTVTKDGTAAYAFVTAYSESGGFTQDFAWNGAYSLNVTQDDTWFVTAKTKTGSSFYKSSQKAVTVDEETETLDLQLVLASDNVPDPVSATFDPTNQAVINLSDGTTINVPAGSIASSGNNVTVTATPDCEVADTSEAQPIGCGLDLTAVQDGTTIENNFNSNVTITQPYDEDEIANYGLDEDELGNSYWNEDTGTWQSPENVVVNTDDNTITTSINHFTVFGITAAGISAPRLTVSNPTRDTTVTVNSVIVEGTVSDVNADLTIALDGTSIGEVEINSETGAFAETVIGLVIGDNIITVDAENGVGSAATITRTVTYDSAAEEDIGVATGIELSLAAMPYSEGGPQIRIFDKAGNLTDSFFAYGQNLRGEFKMVSADLNGDGDKEIITAPGEGFGPQVRVFAADGTLLDSFFVLAEGFRGGIDLKVADITGDGNVELLAKPSQDGGPNIRIFQWNTDNHSFDLLDWFWGFNEGFRGEIDWLVNDIDNDSASEIIFFPLSQGGPNIRIYEYANGEIGLKDWFWAYDQNFLGGVKVMAGDMDGDDIKEIVTIPNQGGGPNIRIYQWNTEDSQYELLDWFWAFQNDFRGEINAKLADLDRDGNKDLVVAPATAGGPNVRTYSYNTETESVELIDWFWAYQESYLGGVNLDVADLDADGNAEIITTPNQDGGPNVRAHEYDPSTGTFAILDWVMAYHEQFRGQVETKIADLDGNGDSELITMPQTMGGPNVRIYDYVDDNLALDNWFWAFAETFRGGVNIQTLH